MRPYLCFWNAGLPMNSARIDGLDIKPLSPELMDSLGTVLRGSWGSTCWCMFPRLTDSQMRGLPGEGPAGPRRREAMTRLAASGPAPGLLAFEGTQPVGWIAVAPRPELTRVSRSRATPPVGDKPVWVIPCITVHKAHRGRGIAVALIQEAVSFAGKHGASTVEAYPRADGVRTADDNAFFGTEPLFTRAGFTVARGPLAERPRNWLPRVAMRTATAAGLT
jgi:GNAT superfamily N-acetyltransferase